MKTFILEGLGTAIMIFVGCFTAAIFGSKLGVLMIGLSFGLGYMLCYYIFRNFCHCHFNPAISLGAYLIGKIQKKEFLFLSLFQFLGALVASLFIALLFLFSMDFASIVNTGLFVNTFGDAAKNNISPYSVIIAELIFTTLFVYVFLKVFYNTDKKEYAGVIVGLVYLLLMIILVNISGGCLNPARAFGPAIVSAIFFSMHIVLLHFLLYLAVTVVGAIIASRIYKRFYSDGSKLKKSSKNKN